MLSQFHIIVLLLFIAENVLINGAVFTRDHEKTSSGTLQYSINDDGSYSFHAGSDPDNFFVDSAGAFLQANKMMYSTKDSSLKLSGSKSISGSDSTGTYTGKLFQYAAGQSRMMAEVAVYNNGEFVRFSQSFPDGLKDCNVSDPAGLLSSFPSLNIGSHNATDGLGFLASFGDMFGYSYAISDLKTHKELIRGGERSGPLVLFDKNGRVMILSSFKNFMAHNMMYDSDRGVAGYGIMGGVTEVPKYYQIDTLLHYSEDGINKAIEKWGQVLLSRYSKKRSHLESDFTVNYLGYYTDNGAYYYYNTEKDKTYADTMLDVVEYAKMNNIPYGYLQYDSWWYYKGVADGVKNWTARPDVFPSGMNNLFEIHGMPVAAHNRFWASDTTYAKKNGGKYDFYVEEKKSIPADTAFWGDLMRSSKPWGLIMYEQDWLVNEFVEMKITHSNVSVARDWMMDMGEGCAETDITVQYCMALPRHMMQSVEIPVVTQARVSGDYHPGNTQWKLGVTSMFAHALYIAPYKDTFWTTSSQPGSPYGPIANEPNVELQAAIATLSTGPVGPGDAVGQTNIDLLMKCCRDDGLILKPSRAITATNENIMKLAFPNQISGLPNTDAEVYSTYSDLKVYTPSGESMMRFGIILAADLTSTSFKFKVDTMYLDDVNPSTTKYVAYQGHPGTDTKIYNVTSTEELTIPPCGLKDFQLWHFSPLVMTSDNMEVAILGERSKWAPISSRRIQQVEIKNGNFLVQVVGKPMEVVSLDFMIKGKVSTTTCTLAADGTIVMSAESQHCHAS